MNKKLFQILLLTKEIYTYLFYINDDINNNNKNEKIEKHILLANKYTIEPYNLYKDLANTKCDITYAQLLDISPKARSEFN